MMTRSIPLGLLTLLIALLLGSAPARAQTDTQPVTDLGNNIYMVDGNKGPIPNLLPAEEVQKIARLQSASSGLGIVSPVSPDDQAVLVNESGRGLAFLNLREGTLTPLQLGLSVRR